MSSNMRLKKICQLDSCKKVFIAKTTKTKFCSDDCAKKAYKIRMRSAKIVESNTDTQEQLSQAIALPKIITTKQVDLELIDILTLSASTGYSRSTIFRLMKDDPTFPRIQTSKRNVKFHKETVMDYIKGKYGNI